MEISSGGACKGMKGGGREEGRAQEGEGGLAGCVATARLFGLLAEGDAADEEAPCCCVLRQFVLRNGPHVVACSLPCTRPKLP